MSQKLLDKIETYAALKTLAGLKTRDGDLGTEEIEAAYYWRDITNSVRAKRKLSLRALAEQIAKHPADTIAKFFHSVLKQCDAEKAIDVLTRMEAQPKLPPGAIVLLRENETAKDLMNTFYRHRQKAAEQPE